MDGFQDSSEFDNQPKNHSLWHTRTCNQGFAAGAFLFVLHEISNEIGLSRSVTW